MKKTFLSIIFLSCFVLTSFAQAELYSTAQIGDNQDLPLPPPNCNCSTDYLPVCGDNGIIYLNACEAECYGVFNYSEGVCEVSCTDMPEFIETYFEGHVYGLVQTFDCHYVILVQRVPTSSHKYSLLKVNSAGDEIWTIDSLPGKFYEVMETYDGALFLMNNEVDSITQNSMMNFYKYNPDGDLIWEKSYPKKAGYAYCENNQDQILVGGKRSDIDNPPGDSLSFFMIDKYGTLLWEKEFLAAAEDFNTIQIAKIKTNSNGEIFASGMGWNSIGTSGGSYSYKFKLLKADADANLLWDKNISVGGFPAKMEDFQILSSGEIIGIGTEEIFVNGSPGYDKRAIVLKLNEDGNEIWKTQLCAQIFNYDRYGRGIAVNNQGLIAAAGNFCGTFEYVVNPPFSGWQCTEQLGMSFLDQDGVADCKFEHRMSHQVITTSDDGFVFAGAQGGLYGTIFIAKTDSLGNPPMFQETDVNAFNTDGSSSDFFEENQKMKFEKISPNPAINEIFITVNSPLEEVVELQIFDTQGALVKSEKMNLYLGENTKELSIADLAPGIFIVKTPQANGQNTAMRFVKLNN